jgi:hypothetical protein
MEMFSLPNITQKIIISFLGFTFLLHSSLIVLAQECSGIGPIGMPSPRNTWKQNTKVKVSIDPDQFNPQEIQCIKDVFDAWNKNNGQQGNYNEVNNNASGVTFEVQSVAGSSSQVVLTPSAPGVPPTATINLPVMPTSSSPLYQINRTAPGSEHDYAETTSSPDSGQSSGNIAIAVTNIDPGINVCQALKEAISHEIGHTFKLNHCRSDAPCVDANGNPTSTMVEAPPCRSGMSNYPACLNQTGIGTVEPTPCDNYKTRIISPAYDPNTLATPTPTPEEGGGGGECPCGDCDNGCEYPPPDEGEPNCSWQTVDGQCYGGYEWTDPYTGILYSEPPSCDPPTEQYVCQ